MSRILVAVAAAFPALLGAAILSVPASAAIINYTVHGFASDTYSVLLNLGPPPPMVVATGSNTDAETEFLIKGDTATAFDVPGEARYIRVTSSEVYGYNKGGLFDVGSILVSADGYLEIGEGAAAGTAAFGTITGGIFTPTFSFTSADLAGYDGISPIGPVSITAGLLPELTVVPSSDLVPVPPGLPRDFLLFDVIYTSFTDASFSAAAPEPASWAMMLLGFAGIGVMRRRHARTADQTPV